MITCFNVADYFLAQSDEEAGDLISNMKLQKLVYYAQGFHLAIHGTALFSDEIEAWQHGPVIPALYHQYKQFGKEAIPIPDESDFSMFSHEQISLMNEVYTVYGQFSAWKLRNMTHEEPTWKEAYQQPLSIISHDALTNYFKTLLN